MPDLSALLARRCNMSSAKADSFVKTFFDLISEGMEHDGMVKVNGLGTFKKIDVASRGSVDVNTGEKIEIKGHSKPVFVPSDSLKDEVNRPFAMFEPVEVGDEYTDTDEVADVDAVSAELDIADAPESPLEMEQPSEIEDITQSVADSTQTEQKETVPSIPSSEQSENVDEAVAQPSNNHKDAKEQKNMSATILSAAILVAVAAVIFFIINKVSDDAPSAVAESAIVQNPASGNAPASPSQSQPLAVQTVEQPKEYHFVLVSELEQTPLAAITQNDTLHYVATDTMVLHRVGLDETLTKISLKYYNDKKLWPYIVMYNDMGNFNNLEIGMELAIPKLFPRN